MTRFLYRAFSLRRSFLNFSLPVHAGPIPTALILPNGTASRSIHSVSGQLIEVDLESASDSDSDALVIKKLDDLVQKILVYKSTPDWLHFIPGSSFWVPPRCSPLKVVDLVEKLTDQLSDDETLSLISDRGWPCSQFFQNDTEATKERGKEVDVKAEEGSAEKEAKMEIKIVSNSHNTSGFEDEEG